MATKITIVVKCDKEDTYEQAKDKAGAVVVELEKIGWWFDGYDMETADELSCPVDFCPKFHID
jgi:hypothetical protein